MAGLRAQSGYKTLLEQSFMPVLRAAEPTLPEGRLAVLYDKNKMVRACLLRTASICGAAPSGHHMYQQLVPSAALV